MKPLKYRKMSIMKAVKFVGWICFFAMLSALIYGFTMGDFFEDGSKILSNPWGIVSLVDLYVGFTIFSIWIYVREKNSFAKLFWIIAMMIFGFFTASIYLLVVAYQSKGDVKRFVFGSNYQKYIS
ncbi:MAG: DUF1475 family protein [Halanaerobiales bacterium]